jgi:endonuclease YncB( thermonuclease family)
MPYRVVTGRYRLSYESAAGRHVGAQPDGDSIWFEPSNGKHLEDLGDGDAKLNAGGLAQLRFEAIDALELHYEGARQKLPECVSARDALLGMLGFDPCTYAPPKDPSEPGTSVRASTPAAVDGFILTRGIDNKRNRRPVAFAFKGRAPARSGTEVEARPGLVRRSLNAKLMAAGHAYPMFYASSLPVDLRAVFETVLRHARRRRLGMWKVDVSTRATRVSGVPGRVARGGSSRVERGAGEAPRQYGAA